MPRKYVSKGNPRKAHVMVKRQNKDAKTSKEAPKDIRGDFYLKSDLKAWTGCKATARAPFLF